MTNALANIPARTCSAIGVSQRPQVTQSRWRKSLRLFPLIETGLAPANSCHCTRCTAGHQRPIQGHRYRHHGSCEIQNRRTNRIRICCSRCNGRSLQISLDARSYSLLTPAFARFSRSSLIADAAMNAAQSSNCCTVMVIGSALPHRTVSPLLTCDCSQLLAVPSHEPPSRESS